MLRTWLERRAVARAAVVGLALGLTALAGLAGAATVTTSQATRHARHLDLVAATWGEAFTQLNAEDAALRHFLADGGTKNRRDPVTNLVGSAGRYLTWLEKHGGPNEVKHVRLIRPGYAGYTRIVTNALEDAEQDADLSAYPDLATYTYVPLCNGFVLNIARIQKEANRYLRSVDRRNTALRAGALGVFAGDLVLFLMCSIVLIGYQRRAERTAVSNLHQARHDSLTGLANRMVLTERIGTAIEEVGRSGGSAGLLLIDLDRFKEVNDTFGHHSGDRLLQQFGERLTALVRQDDLVARLGGDEFAILLTHVASEADAVDIAQRVVTAASIPITLDNARVEIGASVGVALYPADSGDGGELMRHADAAMYAAKRGRYGVGTYDPDAGELGPNRLALTGELREGIARGEFALEYRPRVDPTGGSLRGVEALVSWQHPTRGLLRQADFLPLIEQTTLADQVAEEALRLAAAQAGAWRRDGYRLPVTVQIPARALVTSSFGDRMVELLRQGDVPPHLFTIMLTETALAGDPHRVLKALLALREHGFRLGVRGLGTGSSSLLHLVELPVDEITIDRRFVSTMATDARNRAVVEASIEIARRFGAEVVAEGVGDEKTALVLAQLRADQVTGDFIAAPMPAPELVAWMSRRRVFAPGSGDVGVRVR